MDAERRHQLKTNELGEAFEKLSSFDFTDRRFIGGVVAVLLVVLGFLGYRWWDTSRQRALANSWSELAAVNTFDQSAGADPSGRLRVLVRGTSDPSLLAAARIRLAAALRIEAQKLPLQREALLDEGVQELQKSLQDASLAKEWRAAALYALAALHEDQRRFDEAAACYRQLEDPRFAGTPFQMLATSRAPMLEELRIDVRFTPGVSPAAMGPPTPPPASPVTVTPIDAPPLPVESAPEPPPSTAPAPGNG